MRAEKSNTIENSTNVARQRFPRDNFVAKNQFENRDRMAKENFLFQFTILILFPRYVQCVTQLDFEENDDPVFR